MNRTWMRRNRAKLMLLSSGIMLQMATTGCPDGPQVLQVFSNSTQALITGVFGLYVKAWVQQAFGL